MRPPATPSYAPQTPTHHDPMATPRCCRPAFCDEPCRWPQPAADPAYSVPFDNSMTACLSLEHWDVEYGRGLRVAMAAAAGATILGGAMRGTPMRRQVGGLGGGASGRCMQCLDWMTGWSMAQRAAPNRRARAPRACS